MDSGKIVRPNAFGEISKERGGTEDFRGSHGFQRQRRMEVEDFVGVIWFLGVMKGGGRRILGDRIAFRGNRWGRRGILGGITWFSGVMEGAGRFWGSHGFQGGTVVANRV